MSAEIANRRSLFSSFRVEEDFTNRQIIRVVGAAALYLLFATFLLCVFYTYILGPIVNPGQLESVSILSFPENFRNQWNASGELRGALNVWFAGTMGMTALFALATGMELSRKLAGPIHRMKSDLTRMGDGEQVFEIVLRDNDELIDVTKILNKTLKTIEQRHAEQCSGEFSADTLLAELAAMRTHLGGLALGPDASPALTQWATEMRDLLDKLTAHCGD